MVMAFDISSLIVAPFGLLFLLSGLLINLLQAVCFVVFRPFSRNIYRRINRVIAELLWLELVWLVDWWAGLEVHLYADSQAFQSMGKEHALVVCNHRSDIDWLVGWVLAQRSGCLGSSLAVMKNSSKLLPVIGWSMWFSEYLFLERNWTKDEYTLKSGLQQMSNYPQPFWLALFVEGTRFTRSKLLAAQEYAISTGLPIPRNVLIPRTKGFVLAVSTMREFVPAIYDMTLAIPKDEPSPTLLRLFKGQSSVVHVHVKRRPMNELPQTDHEVSKWCKDIFMAKDTLLDQHLANNTFGDGEFQPIGRPKKSLLVVISWSCILLIGIATFLIWSSLLYTWKGIASFAACLLLVTLVMHVFIMFSQSEGSIPPKTGPTDPAFVEPLIQTN